MSELSRLLVKGIRTLPQEEQDTVLAELLETRVEPSLPATLHSGVRSVEVERLARQELRLEGGPWQTVPVRLSTEQHERLKQWCQANGFTMAVVLRGLVARFLDAQSRRAKPGETPEAPP